MKVLRLEHTLALLIAFCLYFFVIDAFFTPVEIVISEENTSPLLLSTETNSPIKTSLYYSIDHAEKDITILIYNLCERELMRKLQKAAARGVDVTVIADPYSSKDVQKVLGPQIKTYLRKPKGLMHLKMVVIDHMIVWLGSANLSLSSLESHGNLCTAFSSKALADYIEKFAFDLIHSEPFSQPPLHIQTEKQTLTLFMHPFHGDESADTLLKRIDQATRRVFVAMYTFTNKELLDALIRAKKRQIDVRVIFDKDSSTNTSRVAFDRLRKAAIPTGIRTLPGLLHHKFAIIDNSLEMGSCNWTKAGFKSNCDFILWLDPLTEPQEEHMHNLWKKIETASTLETR